MNPSIPNRPNQDIISTTAPIPNPIIIDPILALAVKRERIIDSLVDKCVVGEWVGQDFGGEWG